MTQVIKLPEEQINKVRTFQEKMIQLMSKLGDIQVQKHNLDLLHAELIADYDVIKMEEKDLITELNEQYGAGKLNMKSGELTVFEK